MEDLLNIKSETTVVKEDGTKGVDTKEHLKISKMFGLILMYFGWFMFTLLICTAQNKEITMYISVFVLNTVPVLLGYYIGKEQYNTEEKK